jgi:hypothetical protein
VRSPIRLELPEFSSGIDRQVGAFAKRFDQCWDAVDAVLGPDGAWTGRPSKSGSLGAYASLFGLWAKDGELWSVLCDGVSAVSTDGGTTVTTDSVTVRLFRPNIPPGCASGAAAYVKFVSGLIYNDTLCCLVQHALDGDTATFVTYLHVFDGTWPSYVSNGFAPGTWVSASYAGTIRPMVADHERIARTLPTQPLFVSAGKLWAAMPDGSFACCKAGKPRSWDLRTPTEIETIGEYLYFVAAMKTAVDVIDVSIDIPVAWDDIRWRLEGTTGLATGGDLVYRYWSCQLEVSHGDSTRKWWQPVPFRSDAFVGAAVGQTMGCRFSESASTARIRGKKVTTLRILKQPLAASPAGTTVFRIALCATNKVAMTQNIRLKTGAEVDDVYLDPCTISVGGYSAVYPQKQSVLSGAANGAFMIVFLGLVRDTASGLQHPANTTEKQPLNDQQGFSNTYVNPPNGAASPLDAYFTNPPAPVIDAQFLDYVGSLSCMQDHQPIPSWVNYKYTFIPIGCAQKIGGAWSLNTIRADSVWLAEYRTRLLEQSGAGDAAVFPGQRAGQGGNTIRFMTGTKDRLLISYDSMQVLVAASPVPSEVRILDSSERILARQATPYLPGIQVQPSGQMVFLPGEKGIEVFGLDDLTRTSLDDRNLSRQLGSLADTLAGLSGGFLVSLPWPRLRGHVVLYNDTGGGTLQAAVYFHHPDTGKAGWARWTFTGGAATADFAACVLNGNFYIKSGGAVIKLDASTLASNWVVTTGTVAPIAGGRVLMTGLEVDGKSLTVQMQTLDDTGSERAWVSLPSLTFALGNMHSRPISLRAGVRAVRLLVTGTAADSRFQGFAFSAAPRGR